MNKINLINIMGCCCSDEYRDMRSGLGKSIGNGLNKKVGRKGKYKLKRKK